MGVVEEELSFSTDLLKGPRVFEKRWSVPVVNGFIEGLAGRLIMEYSSWAGEVLFRVTVTSDGKEVFKNDFIVFNGIKPTIPFNTRSVTIDVNLPINTKVNQGIVNVDFKVSTTMGSIKGTIRNLQLTIK